MSILHVRQTIYFVPDDRRSFREPREWQVVKIGRKWASCRPVGAHAARHPDRVDLETLAVDGREFASPGRCWLSLDDWEAFKRATQTYTRLRRALAWGDVADGVTVEDIEAAAKLLRLELPE